MNFEYSVAYSHKTEEDIEILSKDFMPFLEGLEIDSNYQHAIKQLPPFFFEFVGKPELNNTSSLPDKWKKIYKEMLGAINNRKLTLLEVDENFGVRFEKQAYEASYLQALFFLMTYYDKFKKENKEIELVPKKYNNFVKRVIEG